MNKNFLIVGILAILLALSVSAAPFIVGSIPDQVKNEDGSAWTLDLTTFEDGTALETPTQLDWSVSSIDNTLINVVVSNVDEDMLTFTTVANAYGEDTITLTLTSETDGSPVTQDIKVTLNPVNDPITFSGVPDQEWKEGETKTLDLSAYVVDVDGSTLVYDVKEELEDIVVSITGSVATFTPDKSSFNGGEEVIFTVSDGVDIVDSNTVDLIVFDEDLFCEDRTFLSGDIGDVSISDFNEPGDGDEFKPGETINVEVEVTNDDNSDIDVIVEAYLYDKEKGKVIESVEVEDNIDEDDERDFDLELVVPYDITASTSRYVVFVKAYEDGDEDKDCGLENVEIEIEKESHDIAVESVSLNPSTVSCGDTVSATLKLWNVGEKDEDDVVASIVDTDLGIEVYSEEFEIEEEDSYVVRLSFKIPENADAGTYNLLAGAEFNSGKDIADEEVVMLVVESCRDLRSFSLDFSSGSDLSFELGVGDEARYMGKVISVEEIVSNLVKLNVDGSDVGLSLGGSETFDLDNNGVSDLKVMVEDVDGMVTLKFTKLSTSSDVFLPVERDSDLMTTLLIVGDAVLVVVLVVILVIVFSRRKK